LITLTVDQTKSAGCDIAENTGISGKSVPCGTSFTGISGWAEIAIVYIAGETAVTGNVGLIGSSALTAVTNGLTISAGSGQYWAGNTAIEVREKREVSSDLTDLALSTLFAVQAIGDVTSQTGISCNVRPIDHIGSSSQNSGTFETGSSISASQTARKHAGHT
jgi:hypothetical protein